MSPDTRDVVGIETAGGIRLEIPSDAGYLSLVRMLVTSITFQRRDIDDERLEDFVLAVSEACWRAVDLHRQGSAAPAPVVVDWREDAEGCTVVVHGAVADREARLSAGGTATPEADQVSDPFLAAVEGDLSLPLIKSLVDELRIEPSGSGADVVMSMRCPAAPPRPDEI